MKEFHKLIKRIGEELGIKITLLSDDWTIVLEKDNRIHYITGYQFDLNHHAIGNILDDKGLFYDLLNYKNILGYFSIAVAGFCRHLNNSCRRSQIVY